MKTVRRGQLLGWARKLEIKSEHIVNFSQFTTPWIRDKLIPLLGARSILLPSLEPDDIAFSLKPFDFLEILFVFREDDEFGNVFTFHLKESSESERIAGEDLVATVDFYLDVTTILLENPPDGDDWNLRKLTATTSQMEPLTELFATTDPKATTPRQIASRRRNQLLTLSKDELLKNLDGTGIVPHIKHDRWFVTFHPLPWILVSISRDSVETIQFEISINARLFPPITFKYIVMVYTNAMLGWK